MADRLDAEESAIRRRIEDEGREGGISGHRQLGAPFRPGNAGAAGPACIAVIEADAVDRDALPGIGGRRRRDALDRKLPGFRPPDPGDLGADAALWRAREIGVMAEPGRHRLGPAVLDPYRQAQRLRRQGETLPRAIGPWPPGGAGIGTMLVFHSQPILAARRDLPWQAPAMAMQGMGMARRDRLADGAAAEGKAAVADAVGIGREREAGEAQFGISGDARLARGDEPVVARPVDLPPIAEQAAAEKRRDGEPRRPATQSDDLAHDAAACCWLAWC